MGKVIFLAGKVCAFKREKKKILAGKKRSLIKILGKNKKTLNLFMPEMFVIEKMQRLNL